MNTISATGPNFTPLPRVSTAKPIPLTEARQKILADGKVEQKEIRVLDKLRISAAARNLTNQQEAAQTDQAVNQAQANLGFIARLQETLGKGGSLSENEISGIAGEIKTRQGTLAQTIKGLESLLKDPSLTTQIRDVVSLELTVAKQEAGLYKRLGQELSGLAQTTELKKIDQSSIRQDLAVDKNQNLQDLPQAKALVIQITQENRIQADSLTKQSSAFVKIRELEIEPGQTGPNPVSVNPTGQIIQTLTNLLRDPQSPASISPELFADAKREGLLPSVEIDRLQATVQKVAESNQKLLQLQERIGQIEASSPQTVKTSQMEVKPTLSNEVKTIIASEALSPDLKKRLESLSPEAINTLNQNPALLKKFNQVSKELTEGLSSAGRSGVLQFSIRLNNTFENFLETQDAQQLALVASGTPSTPQLAQYLIKQSGIAEVAQTAQLQKQIKPFQDAAGLLAGRNIELDFGKDAKGKALTISGKDLNRGNYVETLAKAAAELGVEPRVFAQFVRNQILDNPGQTRFVIDTPEKKQAFKSAADQAAQAPATKSQGYLASGADLFSNLKEGLEAPQKILNRDLLSGTHLEREDARPQNITESLNKLNDPNATKVEKLAAAGTLIQAYKGFLERFNALADSQDKQTFLKNFLGPGTSPEAFIKGIDGLGAFLGTPNNLIEISNNLRALYQGSDPLPFQAVSGSNALQLSQGSAAIFKAGDSVTIEGKDYKVKSVDSDKNQIELDPPPTLVKGELRANFSLKDKAIKGLEIVVKTSDIIESIDNLRKGAPYAARALLKGAKLVKDEAKLLKGAIAMIIKDVKLAEKFGEFVNSLQKTFNAISPGVGDQFISALSQKPELLKKFAALAKNINSYVGLDKFTEGLKNAIPKIAALEPEKIAEATSKASGPGALAAKAESRIPLLGFLANVGFLAKDVGTLIDDYNAGKDDFNNFNNLVGVISDVASLFPAGQSVSLVLDSYSIGIGVGTFINESSGLKETIQNQVKFKNGISDEQIAQDTFYSAINKEGVIGNGEALLRTAQRGVGRAIVGARGEEDLKRMLVLSIDGDLQAGRISKTEALLLRRNANLPEPGGLKLDNASYRRLIEAQLNEDLDAGKISMAEALVFKLALDQEPPSTLAGVTQNRGSVTISVKKPLNEGSPTQRIIIDPEALESPAKAEKKQSPGEINVPGFQPETGEIPAPTLPPNSESLRVSSAQAKEKGFQIQTPIPPSPSSPQAEPEISVQIPKSPPELVPSPSGDGTITRAPIPSFRGTPLTREEVASALNNLSNQVNAEKNPVKRLLLQNKLDKLKLYVKQGAPGSLQPLF
jgi:hypothetical protein